MLSLKKGRDSLNAERMKKLFWIGLAVFIVSFVCGFLSGATNGPANAPLVPFLYGTNQVMWLFFAVIGGILALAGGIGAIVQKIKSRKAVQGTATDRNV
ncbi:MAG: hypothetical protein V1656_01555 [Candidatus Jorgensenbacteria bacterium]